MPSTGPSVSVIVPLHGTEPTRAAAWAWVRRRYAMLHTDWEIVEARADEEPWRKGVALTRGVMAARGDVFVVSDADVAIAPEALHKAIVQIEADAAWVVPHRVVHRLDKEATAEVLASRHDCTTFGGKLARPRYAGFPGGGIFVVSRANWIRSGGIPHEFAGWGKEDESLGLILDTLCGPHVRMEYDLFHLWHEAPAVHTTAQQNQVLLDAYAMTAGDTGAMRRLILHGPENLPRRDGKIYMIALERFPRGAQIIEKGQVFTATHDEARRHAMRSRKIAQRCLPGVMQQAGSRPVLNGGTTHQPSFEEQRLAAANERRKAARQ